MTDTTGPRDAAWEQEYGLLADTAVTRAITWAQFASGRDMRLGLFNEHVAAREALDAHVLTEVARLREALETIARDGDAIYDDGQGYGCGSQIAEMARRALHTDTTD